MGIHPQTKDARWCYLNKDRSITDQALIVLRMYHMYVCKREKEERKREEKQIKKSLVKSAFCSTL